MYQAILACRARFISAISSAGSKGATGERRHAPEPTALGQFRALVMADPALAEMLNREVEIGRFAESAAESAATHSIALTANAVRAEIQTAPLGLSRWLATPMLGSAWPPKFWLPIQVATTNGQFFVDWAYFGAAPLTQSFFEDSIRRALSRPFNRMFRYRIALSDFVDNANRGQSLPPSGFVFHMSRCGSTLVSQTLAALPSNIAVSEAAPIDAIVQLSRIWPNLPPDRHANQLTAMIAAFGQRRAGGERRYFIKLDSWHTLALPLFRRAFPATPWVFLYRDPVEVLVSQMHIRGAQMVPQILPPRVYGIEGFDGLSIDEYTARVLAKVCEAALGSYGDGGGLLVNYRELPGAIWTKILPHFGITVDERERDMMNRPTRFDAKAPDTEFTNDTVEKQDQATELIRSLADRHLGEIYRRLEGLNVGGN